MKNRGPILRLGLGFWVLLSKAVGSAPTSGYILYENSDRILSENGTDLLVTET